jgi:hypothetical protein
MGFTLVVIYISNFIPVEPLLMIAFILLIATGITGGLAYRYKSTILFLFSTILGGVTIYRFLYSDIAYRYMPSSFEELPFLLLYAGLLFLISYLVPFKNWQNYSRLLALSGGWLYLMNISFGGYFYPAVEYGTIHISLLVACVVLFVAAVIMAIHRSKITIKEVVGVTLISFFPTFWLIFVAQDAATTVTQKVFELQTEVAFSIITIFFMLGALFNAQQRRLAWQVNWSMLALFFFTCIWYLTWFDDIEYESLFLLITGLFLLGLGYLLEKTRRRVLKNITS